MACSGIYYWLPSPLPLLPGRAGGFALAEYYTVDLVRSSLNPVGGLGVPAAGGGYGTPGPASLPGFPQPPPPPRGDDCVGIDPLKAYNVVRASTHIARIDLANLGQISRGSDGMTR